MAVKTMNISLPEDLKGFIESRVRSGLYGSPSDVIRAGLRALAREEIGPSVERFEQIMSNLPQDPLSPTIELRLERSVRAACGKASR